VCSARVADAAAGADAAGSCDGAADRWCRRAALGRSLRQDLEKVARRNVGGVGLRAAQCVDLHAHDHEERGEEGPFVAGHRAPRRVICPRPLKLGIRLGTGEGMGAAGEQAKGKGEGGRGAAPPLGLHAGAGWAELHLVLTAGDIGRHSRGRGLGQVAYDVG